MSSEKNDALDGFGSLENALDNLKLEDVEHAEKRDVPRVPGETPIDSLVPNETEGDCLIFNYENYKKGRLESRPGSRHDADRLKHVFQELGFNVYPIYLDLPESKVLEELSTVAKKIHSKSKYFVCCFLTHGKERELSAYDKGIELEVILNMFSRHSCRTLADKPKIFILQACRGSGIESSIKVRSNICTENEGGTNDCVAHGDSTDGGALVTTDSPKVKNDRLDFLVVNSTYPGMVSYKSKDPKNINNYGSYFIDEFCHSMEQFSKELNFLEILTIVNYRMAHNFESITKRKDTDGKKQMSCFSSNLRERIFFNKNITPLVSDATRFFDKRLDRQEQDPFTDKKSYVIQNSKNIQFLSLVIKQGDFSSQIKESAAHLWNCIARRDIEQRSEAKHDLSRSEIGAFLKKFAGQEFSGINCFICFIATYCRDEYLLDCDRMKFSKEDIVEAFVGKKYKAFAGKPKIFIFLMCKSPPKKPIFPIVFADHPAVKRERIPVHADILEISIKCEEPDHITKSMKEFCKIFEENKHSEDVLSLLTRINSNLEKNSGFYSLVTNQSILTFNSTLTKTLILP